MKKRLRFATACVILAAILFDTCVWGCGFFRNLPIFYSRDHGQKQTYDGYAGYGDIRHPYVPLTDFFKGDLGVIRPQFGYLYLWVAYRYLTNKPLSKTDVDFLMNYSKADSENYYNMDKKWAAKADTILNMHVPVPDRFVTFHGKTQVESFENCTNDAFRFAVERFEKIKKQHGENSQQLINWVKRQQQVFQNCSLNKALILPEPLLKNASQDEKHEYTYQVASSHFYAMDYGLSANEFEKIAKDSTSPYKDIALYLVFRSRYRNFLYIKPEGEKEIKSWHASIIERIQNYLGFTARVERPATADDAQKIFIETYNRWQPEIIKSPYRDQIEGFYAHVQKIEPMGLIKIFGEKLVDTTRPLSFDLISDFNYFIESRPELSGDKKLYNEFFEWRRLLRSKESYKHAYEYWKKDASPLWLIAVLEKITIDAPELEEVLLASEKIEPNSPAYMTVTYLRAKLYIAKGDVTKGNEMIDKALMKPVALATKNRFMDLKVAKSYTDFLQNILQRPVLKTGDHEMYFLQKIHYLAQNEQDIAAKKYDLDFDWDHFDNVQQAPIALLLEAAQHKDFPTWFKENLLIAAFSRSVILNHEQEAIDAAKQLRDIQPQLRESMDLFLNEKDSKRRFRIGHFIIARTPKMSIFVHPNSWRNDGDKHLAFDDYDVKFGFHDRWWSNADLKKLASKTSPAFLSADVKKQNEEQFKTIAEKVSDKTDYFCKLTLDWFKDNPKDPLLPEMMHRCIRMSRYARDTDSDLKSSYDVFRLLKKYFKNNEYEKKTPFHYY